MSSAEDLPRVGKTLVCELECTQPNIGAGRKMALYVDGEPTPRLELTFAANEHMKTTGPVPVVLSDTERDVKVTVRMWGAPSESGNITYTARLGQSLNWVEQFWLYGHSQDGRIEAAYTLHCTGQ